MFPCLSAETPNILSFNACMHNILVEVTMTTKQETIRLLDQLIEAMKELNKIWDGIEEWSEANLEPTLQEAA